jgi:hypothetical protein
MGIFSFEDGTSDPVLTRIVDEDKVPVCALFFLHYFALVLEARGLVHLTTPTNFILIVIMIIIILVMGKSN